MKLRLPPRPLFSCPSPHRPVSRYTLYIRHRDGLYIRSTYLPRCKLWMTHPKHARQRRILLLHLHLPPHWPRSLLWLLSIQRNMEYWSCSPSPSNDDRFRRLCITLRPNIFLRRHRYHQPSLRRPLRRQRSRPMNLRRLLS